MISESSIAQECANKTFTRARLVMRNDGFIHRRRCDYEPEQVELRAVIESMNSWDDYPYDTKLVFREETGEVLDYECTCQAFGRYPGMCKHIAGLGLLFNKNPHSFVGYESVRTVSTSRSLQAFMKQQEQQRLRKARVTEAPQGNVGLELFLDSSRHEKWSASFKIAGPAGSYVVKDLQEFLANIEHGRFHEYGAKLGFTHVMEAFDPEAQRIIQFLQHFTATNSNWFRPSAYSQNNSIFRYLYLPESSVVELLDLQGFRPFTFSDFRHPKSKARLVQVKEANPVIPLKLSRIDDTGWELQRGEEVGFLCSGGKMYAWDDAGFYRCTTTLSDAYGFISSVYSKAEEQITISDEDLPRFCATVLPLLSGPLKMDAPAELEALKPVECRFEFYLDTTEKGFECEAKALYGDDEFNLFVPDNEPGKPLRDSFLEDQARALVDRFLPERTSDGNALAYVDDDMARLLFQGVEELQAVGEVFTTSAFNGMTKRSAPSTSVGISIKSGLVDIEVSTDGMGLDEIEELLASYHQKKSYHRLKDGAFLRMDDALVQALELDRLELMTMELGISSKELAKGHLEAPLFHAFMLEDEFEAAEKDEAFQQFVRDFEDNRQAFHQIPPTLENTLRPYQKTGFSWLNTLMDCGFGGVLADEMGLGKSLQVISALLHHQADLCEVGPALIVCPASLVYNWLAEFAKFAPQLKVATLAGSKDDRLKLHEDLDCEVLITSYDTCRIDVEELDVRTYFAIILDEAQYIKNHNTQAAKAVKRLNGRNRLALTGTPIENRLSELWSIFDFLMPGMLGPYSRFRDRYEAPIVDGDQESANRLKAKVGPFILRRLKADVLTDLPEKMETVVQARLEPEQQDLYDAHEQRLLLSLQDKGDDEVNSGKIALLAELTKLRQLCCDPRLLYTDACAGAKLEVVADLIENAVDSGQKVLVFSQFTSFLDIIAKMLDQNGWAHYSITGATPKKRRMELVDQFNADDVPVFLISLKAGGTGLNLVGASIVIHADPWWNAAAQNQATDRAHRIGQTRDVSVFKVIARGTIEERILNLQEKKSDLADQVLAADGASLGSMSREDIIGLLSGD